MVGRFRKAITGPLDLLLLFSIILSALRCEDEKPPKFVDIVFVLPFSVSPTLEQISIGDTIWLTAEIPDTILEFNSGEYFKLDNFNFYSRFGIVALVDNQLYLSEQPGAIESFSIVNQLGEIKNVRETFSDLQLVYKGNSYSCTIAFIPQQTGIFTMEFLRPDNLSLDVLDLGHSDDGSKQIPVYRGIYYTVNNGLNNNFDLLRVNCKPASIELPIPDNIYAEQKGTFTFRVIE